MEESESHYNTAYLLISILQKETIMRSDSVMSMWISLLGGVPDSYAIQVSSG